jgi:hypothetical protein
MFEYIKKCFLCNNDNNNIVILREIQENIDINHKESLQIIINCIDYVKDNIKEINTKINNIKEIENDSTSNLIINLRQRSSSI